VSATTLAVASASAAGNGDAIENRASCAITAATTLAFMVQAQRVYVPVLARLIARQQQNQPVKALGVE
jgi:hypothetical protein